MILGHAHPAVVEAAVAAVRNGSSYGAPCEAESELAEMVVEAVPSIDMVRFVSSGTEATMSALRLARGFTGRDLVVKFAGCYHGHVDALLVSAGSSALTLGVPEQPGRAEGVYRRHARAPLQRRGAAPRRLPGEGRPRSPASSSSRSSGTWGS